MIIDTDKSLIVFYYKPEKEYKFCGVCYFQKSFENEDCTPILYTSSLRVARKMKQKLNKFGLD